MLYQTRKRVAWTPLCRFRITLAIQKARLPKSFLRQSMWVHWTWTWCQLEGSGALAAVWGKGYSCDWSAGITGKEFEMLGNGSLYSNYCSWGQWTSWHWIVDEWSGFESTLWCTIHGRQRFVHMACGQACIGSEMQCGVCDFLMLWSYMLLREDVVWRSRFEFLLWGREPILYQSIKIPNLSHYKMMVLNPQRITENDSMILLQNEDWFLSWGYLKGKFHHYKMTIGFYHQVTRRGHSATTKSDWFLYAFIIRLLEGNTSILQNEDWFLSSSYLKGTLHHYKWRLVFICFYHQVTWREHFRRATSLATKWDWVFNGFYMLSSDGQILLLQNDFRFLKVFQLPKRWQLIKCNSQAAGTKCLAHPHFFILI